MRDVTITCTVLLVYTDEFCRSDPHKWLNGLDDILSAISTNELIISIFTFWIIMTFNLIYEYNITVQG